MSHVEFLIHYCHKCYYIPSFRLSFVLKLTKEGTASGVMNGRTVACLMNLALK